ncbi:hypothetical protein KO488_03590 [Poseidonibacter lekithochrous]|uniref:hypothetical protein n=1 Tax=Poseidonibacter TaxID=2321187 RepID=UPI001C09EAF3|nr:MULTISPECIES: hypothetical protein [Poseidonibacter]MBU3013826.1 hypothetical protein [Poseidonibacter lekithochrous]MDO6827122.1 hypothetical protein [Poseidonibacter sp. 1_MG-2023]
MISKIILVMSFIFISNIFASEIIENNFDEANKVIDKKIEEYNPSEKYNIKFSKEELNILCKTAHTSSACETVRVSVENEVIKKRISFILRKISKKYNIDENFLNDSQNKFVKYIEKKEKLDGPAFDCSSSICYVKSIWSELINFENNLTLILNNEDIKSDFEYSLNDFDDLYIDIDNAIYMIKYNKDYDSKELKKEFDLVNIKWIDYENTLNNFLKKVNKYDIKWIKLFYKSRYSSLNAQKEYFYSLLTVDEHTGILEPLILSELDNYNKDNNKIVYSFEKKYELNDNEILYLYSSAPKDFDCHACIPKMNWFHFKKENNNWNIKNKILNIETDYGSWGDLVPPKLIRTVENLILFKTEFTYSNQGFSNEYIKLEVYKNGDFIEVFTDETSFDDAGAYEIEKNNWESKITFIESSKILPNLLVEKFGLKDSKDYYENKIYEFKNEKYILKHKE